MLFASGLVIGLQSLYTVGQIYDLLTKADKAGGRLPHVVNIGSLGISLYLATTAVIGAGLLAGIQGSDKSAVRRISAALLALSVIGAAALVGLVEMSWMDAVRP